MAETVLELNEIRSVSGGRPVLDGVSLKAEKSGIHAIVGEAGSGKTELLQILAGLKPADGGEARIFGRDVKDAASRKEVGMLVEEPALWPELSIAGNLEMQSRILGKRDRHRLGKLMKALQILPRQTGNRRAGSCPASIRQRLGTALALVGSPMLVLLDEPFLGLDSDDSICLRELLKSETAERGMTTVMTAAFFSEVWDTADVFYCLNGGKLEAVYTREELQTKLPEETGKSGDLDAFWQSLRKGEDKC